MAPLLVRVRLQVAKHLTGPDIDALARADGEIVDRTTRDLDLLEALAVEDQKARRAGKGEDLIGQLAHPPDLATATVVDLGVAAQRRQSLLGVRRCRRMR